jgi:hypothetical protein
MSGSLVLAKRRCSLALHVFGGVNISALVKRGLQAWPSSDLILLTDAASAFSVGLKPILRERHLIAKVPDHSLFLSDFRGYTGSSNSPKSMNFLLTSL